MMDASFWGPLFGLLTAVVVTIRYLAGYYFKMQIKVLAAEDKLAKEKREATEKTVQRLEKAATDLSESNKALQNEIIKNTSEIKKLEALIAETVGTLAKLSQRTDHVETELKITKEQTEKLKQVIDGFFAEENLGRVVRKP